MLWRTPHWSELDTAQLRSHIYRTLHRCTFEHETKYGTEVRAWNPDKRKVANVVEAMEALAHLGAEIDPPAWIQAVHSAAETTAGQMISCTNGLLGLSTRELSPHTPAWFNLVSVPFAYHDDPGEPVEWLRFLESVWGDDAASTMLLQEYIGYLLSGHTYMQKMLLLVGPPRSGKGTIGRLLRKLLGRGHVTGPTLAGLATNFGLSPLLGKPLAIVSDARLGKETNVVVERLLSITGEDTLTVDRKYREPWTGKLPTRFVILTNEVPRFRDASGAIANRMLILQLTESFLGHEDHELDAKIGAELPAILVWALEGLDRLLRNDRFTVPSSSADAITQMMDLASPVGAFVRERCRRAPDAQVAVDDLYAAWREWCEMNGHRAGAKSTFGRDLRAVAPEVRIFNPRVAGKQVRYYSHIGRLSSSPSSAGAAGTDIGPDEGSSLIGDPPNPEVRRSDEADEGKDPIVGPYSGADEGNPAPHPSSNPASAVPRREVHCCACGAELLAPESIRRGNCTECFLCSKPDDDPPPF
jgi:putative DNA primase/helicase